MILVVIFFLSILQSIFGTGLLVFGTPIMLALGFEYYDVLACLLPASLVVSFSQIYRDGVDKEFKFIQLVNVLAGVSIGVLVSGQINTQLITYVVIGMLTFSLIIAKVKSIKDSLTIFISNKKGESLLLISILHGMCNMGGVLLTMYASTVEVDKGNIRKKISTVYVIFASAMLISLIGKPISISPATLIFSPITAFLVFQILGCRIYGTINSALYARLMEALVAIMLIGLMLRFLLSL